MPLSNTNDNLTEIIQNIDSQANKLGIDKLALALTAEFSSLCDIQKFIHAYKVLATPKPNPITNQNSKQINLTLIFYKKRRIINDPVEVQRIIEYYHDSPIGGHVGSYRLWKKLKAYFEFKNMQKQIKTFVENCIQCKMNKHSTKTNEQYTETSTPHSVFETISIDTIGPMTKTQNGNRYALTMQCDLSKYVIVVPIQDKQAQTLAKAFVENLILVFGCPKNIKSDLGTEYKNEVFEKISQFLQLNQKFSTAYHPQTIGSLERNHRCLNEYLRSFTNELHDDWDSWLPYYCFCYNTTPNTDTQYTPFEIVFGKQVNFPTYTLNKIEPMYNHEEYYTQLKFKLQTIAQRVRDIIVKTKLKRIQNQKSPNPIILKVGDKILIKSETNKKLDNIYEGPYNIVSLNHPNITIFHTPSNKNKEVHKNRVIKYSI